MDMETATDKSKEVVLRFINALNEEDFETAQQCLSDDMVFEGVLGRREGSKDYIKDMKKMKFKYSIQKAFEDDDDVCLWYDINMSGKTVPTCGWYHLDNGKIQWFKVLFDPRPLLAK
jgi:limonene-1,2-epoxide hydrolase